MIVCLHSFLLIHVSLYQIKFIWSCFIFSYVNGISFNFFVHGENIVCATVCVQRQPTLFRLSRRHLDLGKKQSVILGPWSMRAVLLPEQPRIVDSTTPILQQQPLTPECGMFSDHFIGFHIFFSYAFQFSFRPICFW